MRAVGRAQVLRQVFGELACDPAPSGAPFHLAAQPTCPRCGSHKMASWEFRQPAVIVERALAPVTHGHWASLSLADKLAALERVLPDVPAPVDATAVPAKPAASKNAWAALLLGRDEALQGRVAALVNIPAMMPTLLPPFHPGDGLGGAVRTLAEALLLFGPARCKAGFDALLPTLPLAVRDMDPHQPGRVPTTQGLLSFVLVAQNAGELAPDAMRAEAAGWLDGFVNREPPADLAARLHCGVLAAGFGSDAQARSLLGTPPAPFVAGLAFDGNVQHLCAYFLDAMDARVDFTAIDPAWQGFVRAFPTLLETNAVNWVSMHAFARLALGRIAGIPVAQLATRTHQQVMRAIAA